MKNQTVKVSRIEFGKAMHIVANSCAKDLEEAGLKVFDNLTEDERQIFTAKSAQYFRFAKTVLCALDDRIMGQWAAEATLPEIKKLRKLRKQRYC